MDTALSKDKSVLAILIFTVSVEVLSDSNSLFDQVVQVIRDGWSETSSFKDTNDLAADKPTNLINTKAITKNDT